MCVLALALKTTGEKCITSSSGLHNAESLFSYSGVILHTWYCHLRVPDNLLENRIMSTGKPFCSICSRNRDCWNTYKGTCMLACAYLYIDTNMHAHAYQHTHTHKNTHTHTHTKTVLHKERKIKGSQVLVYYHKTYLSPAEADEEEPSSDWSTVAPMWGKARWRILWMLSPDSLSSTMTRQRLSRALFTWNEGFSVVAPISVIVPSSTWGSRTSC